MLSRKWENLIIALLTAILSVAVITLCFDYYYDLNDDVLIKDIISGQYSGEPLSRNIQMQFFMSGFFALLYRICGNIAWYGIFLLIFQFGSLFLITYDTLSFFSGESFIGLKILTVLSENALLCSLMLMHLSNVQYTVSVAMMCGAVIFHFAVTPKEYDAKHFLIHNIPTLIILFTAFLLRSEMFLLMCPFIAIIGICKWGLEPKDAIFSKESLMKYLSLVGMALVLVLVGFVGNKLSYASPEYKEFSDLFDERTRLYDYEGVPSYEDNAEFYESIDLSKEEQILLENYNYALCDKYDSTLMGAVADYSKTVNASKQPFSSKFTESLRLYIYEFTHGRNDTGSDYPYNYVVIVLYALLLFILIGTRHFGRIWEPILLFAVRSAIWMYILMGGRYPDRITHSLYFIEIALLLALICIHFEEVNKRTLPVLLMSLIGIVFAITIWPQNYDALKADATKRAETNAPYIALYEYMNSQPENYYYLDVYSTVSYSEKMFDSMKNVSKANSDLLGGWFALSPVYREKAQKLGISEQTIDSQLTDSDKVFYVKNDTESMDYLYDYYAKWNVDISVTEEDMIADTFTIYRIERCMEE